MKRLFSFVAAAFFAAFFAAAPALAQQGAGSAIPVYQSWFPVGTPVTAWAIDNAGETHALPSGGSVLNVCNQGAKDVYITLETASNTPAPTVNGAWLPGGASACRAFSIQPASVKYTYIGAITGGSDTTTLRVEAGVGSPLASKLSSGGGGSGVTSFNTRTGAVTLSSGDVTTALGFTPAQLSSFSGTAPISYNSGTGAISCPTCGVTGSPLSQFASTTSAQLFGIISNPTGSGGSLVFATGPTISALTVTGSFTATGLVTNADLTNSSLTIGSTSCSLGATCATLAGLTLTSPAETNTTVTGSFTATGLVTNADLANPATTVNGQTCTLGSSCTAAAAAGTLTGTTLAAGVVSSSLTSVGTIATGVWQGTAVGGQWGGTGANLSAGVLGDVVKFGSTGVMADSGVLLSSLAPLASPAFSGTPTDSGNFAITGTAAPTLAAGTVGLCAACSPSLAANGEGMIYESAAGGLILQGQGSANDLTVANKSGSTVFAITTGTTTLVLSGGLTLSGSVTNGGLIQGANTHGYDLLSGACSSTGVTISPDAGTHTGGIGCHTTASGNPSLVAASTEVLWASTTLVTFDVPYGFSSLLCAAATPTISSGFGSSPSVTHSNGSCAFTVNVGTGGSASAGVIALNATAANAWICSATDTTTNSTSVFVTKQTPGTLSTTTASLTQYSDAAAATAWAASDILQVSCHAT